MPSPDLEEFDVNNPDNVETTVLKTVRRHPKPTADSTRAAVHGPARKGATTGTDSPAHTGAVEPEPVTGEIKRIPGVYPYGPADNRTTMRLFHAFTGAGLLALVAALFTFILMPGWGERTSPVEILVITLIILGVAILAAGARILTVNTVRTVETHYGVRITDPVNWATLLHWPDEKAVIHFVADSTPDGFVTPAIISLTPTGYAWLLDAPTGKTVIPATRQPQA